MERGGEVRYLSTGHLVYNNAGTLAAVAFDAKRLEVSGEPVPVVEGVRIDGISSSPQFDISQNGSMTYLPGPISGGVEATLAFVDRNGVSRLPLPPDLYRVPRVSSNGKRITYDLDLGKESNVYVYDLEGKTSPRRLTLTGANRYPIWLGDEVVAFQSDRDGDLGIFAQRADGNDSAERLTRAGKDEAHIPDSWSPAAQALSYTVTTPTTSTVWSYSLRDKKSTAFAEGPLLLGRSAFSPDGRWLAYHAYDDTAMGKVQLFAQAFPTGVRHQIAVDTLAHSPLWSRDGRELFYIYEPAKLASVRVDTTPSFVVGNPVRHTVEIGDLSPLSPRMYDVTPDGRFLTILPAAPRDVKLLHVVLNWFDDVSRRVAAK
jgi:serine/threonine-protein kinase